MTARILDGKALAATIKAELRDRVATLADRGFVPGLGTVLVGDDPGSRAYVRGKHRDCAEVGIASIQVELPDTTSQDELEAVIADLNADPGCTGYIVNYRYHDISMTPQPSAWSIPTRTRMDFILSIWANWCLARPRHCRVRRVASLSYSGVMASGLMGPRSA